MFFYLLIALLVLCFYQDVKFRGVHWILFPLLLVASYFSNIKFDVVSMGTNILFLTLMMLFLSFYISARKKKWTNITKGYFSWGDILFLLALSPLFSFEWYLLYFTFGTILTLLFHIIASLFSAQKTIPYAGYMALVGIFYLFSYPYISQIIL